MSKQLNIFEQKSRDVYEDFYQKFYAGPLRRAKESRKKLGGPDYTISIHPDTMGEKIYIKDLLIKNRKIMKNQENKHVKSRLHEADDMGSSIHPTEEQWEHIIIDSKNIGDEVEHRTTGVHAICDEDMICDNHWEVA